MDSREVRQVLVADLRRAGAIHGVVAPGSNLIKSTVEPFGIRGRSAANQAKDGRDQKCYPPRQPN
jgi:hypothetical protein